MNLNDLVYRIGFFRNKANLSARELSMRIGKSDTYINKVECKDFVLSIPVFFDIIEALEITCEEFFADNFMSYRKDKEMNNIFKNLSDGSKSTIIDLMKKMK